MSSRSSRSEETHIPDPISAMATASPDHVMVRSAARGSGGTVEIREWTAAEFDRWVHQIERCLVASGTAPGTPVAVVAPRCPATVALLWAIWRVGGIAVPLNTRLPASAAVEQSARAGAQLVISADDDVVQLAMQSGIRAGAFSSLTAPPEDARSEASEAANGGAFPEEASLRASLLPLDARATAVFTSGSTGTPKLAVHTLGNHVYSARGSAENIPLTGGDAWLASLPLYHVGGLAILFRCALAGATVSMPAEDMPVEEAVRRLRPTHLSLVATQLKRLLDATRRGANGSDSRRGEEVEDGDAAGEGALASLKAMLLGGSAIPSGLLDIAHERGWPVHTSYGSTEMASQVTTTPPNASREMLATSGQCLPYRSLSICDPDGAEVEAGSTGEIRVGGKTLFAGYAAGNGAHGALDTARTPSGDVRTGDLGRIDSDGCLHVTGRVDRLIISGGENIQPEEVEAALEQCEGVVRAAVVGVPDEEFGERPVAFVEWETTPRDLESDLRALLPGYKLPKAVYAMPEKASQNHLKLDFEVLKATARKLQN